MNAAQLAEYIHKAVFSISFAGRTVLPAGFRQEPYLHGIHSIHFIVSGRGYYVMNDKKYRIEAGMVMIFVPETVFEWWIDDEEPVVIYHIRFDYQLLYKDKMAWLHQMPDDTLLPLRGALVPVRPAWIRQQFESVYALWQSYDPFSQYRIGLAFRELWLSVVEDIRDMQTRSDTDAAIERTCEYMADRYSTQLSVERLASIAGFSTGYYTRQFKRLYGCSPKDYLIQLRVNKAKELIGTGRYPLSEVAHRVGYSDEFYFSRIFKRVTGMTPSLYARQSDVGSPY